ncbi:MAG: hypothetical protein K0Q43_102 [Ramlibacter sp.]|jgi:hypothetical protein|nr:hypothetical protein [Ramlibacter sp.]
MENTSSALHPEGVNSAGACAGTQTTIDIYAGGVRASGQWISVALVAPQVQAWTYLEQMEPPGALLPHGEQPKGWVAELRKVPRAHFVKSERELLDAAAAEVARISLMGCGDGIAAAPMLRVALDSDLATALGVPGSGVQVRSGLARKFLEHSNGGRRLSRQHALLYALELAACDGQARHPLAIEDITRFELLLGTKNAQSMRAWLRRRAVPGKADALRLGNAPVAASV